MNRASGQAVRCVRGSSIAVLGSGVVCVCLCRECREMIDVDTGNLFYLHETSRSKGQSARLKPVKPQKKKTHDDFSDDDESSSEEEEEEEVAGDETGVVRVYSWQPTLAFVREDVLLNAWTMLHRRSKPLRAVGRWTLCLDTTAARFGAMPQDPFYLLLLPGEGERARQQQFQASVPQECEWSELCGSSSLVGRVGRREEWDVFRTRDGSALFYRSNQSMADAVASFRVQQAAANAQLPVAQRRPVPKFAYTGMEAVCRWDPPLFAVDKSCVAKLCTATVHGQQKALQGYYTCEQCARRGGATQPARYCVPCGSVCHEGHSGLKYVKKAFFVCECAASHGGKCMNLDAEEREEREMRMAIEQLEADCRRRKDAEERPVLLAFVPPRTREGEGQRQAKVDDDILAFTSKNYSKSPRSGAASKKDRKKAWAPSAKRWQQTVAPHGWCICRRVAGTQEVDGWVVVSDPHEPLVLEAGWEVLAPRPGMSGLYPATVGGPGDKPSEYRLLFKTERPREPGRRKPPPPLIEEEKVWRILMSGLAGHQALP